MVDFSLTEEEQAIRATTREFVRRELMPLENDVLRREREGLPGVEPDVVQALRAKAKSFGFWGLSTPEQYGGMNLSAVDQALITSELGRTFVPFSFGGEADNILYECNEEQRKEYLLPTISGERRSCFAITEPGAGSDTRAIRTTARRDGDDWIIRGEKTFITGGNEADFAIVIAVTDPEKGSKGGFTAFLVDRERGWTSDRIVTMGQAVPATLNFDDVRVPGDHVLGEIGQGYELAMRWIMKGRFIIPARGIGACERLLELAIEHATSRETFGRPIADNQAIQWMIADSEVEMEAARWLVLYAAWAVDQGRHPQHDSAIAKLYGTNTVNRIADRVLQIHGGMGYTKELPIERWFREVRLWRIFEGTDEMQRLIISRGLLRGYRKPGAHFH
ncbi:acyl-CoA dehydrogenase domain protein [Kribbella flavida DSM 17836]|uniref:Medium-chain specific acyl-CoA dehydrogenase, mitochondrial n=1 Tax=Kribbella flavida (strain DSM 17836 / JCM 10339 / NBRC 14399) TaxID=479435 RepID=D2PUK7_KRIFD|nr:acyl-CoA dehydrogenase family protein [Kribbella flavida]ADB29525.1 acyl-CoA dehydrogenase domain protein [Kribbella flavida DSM 17836]